MILIVDASAFAPLLIPEERHAILPGLEAALSSARVIVPAHWTLEIANLLLVASRRRRIDAADVSLGFATLESVAVEVDAIALEQDAARDLWDLASKHRLTVYDAAYLELAARTKAVLATCDKALVRAARDLAVELFGR